jgi:hypothetical protein
MWLRTQSKSNRSPPPNSPLTGKEQEILLPYSKEQGIILAEQGIFAREQGILPAKIEIIAR